MRNRLLPGIGARTRLQSLLGPWTRLLGIGLLSACTAVGCQGFGERPPSAGDSLATLEGRTTSQVANKNDGVQVVSTRDTDDRGFFTAYVEDHQWDLSVRHWNWFGLMKDDEVPVPAAASVVLRGDGVEETKSPLPGTPAYRLAGAHELLRQGKYAHAEAIFHRIAEHAKYPVRIVEEARYYEGECLRLQKYYPDAADVYSDLMGRFPNNPYREQAVHHMFDIANYWLEDTRDAMAQNSEMREGKRWVAWHNPVHLFDRSKPVFDEQGRAVELLEKVQLGDITGPLSDKALFLCGGVKYYDENFAEADYYFSQIHERHPNSPLAEQAVELGIISKHLSTGGSDYDGRKAAEARILVNSALNNYPGLASEKQEFLMNQLKNISYQQAEKDFKLAEFWARTGHPGSAFWYFTLVLRRYPGTKFAEQAAVRRDQLRAAAEKEEDKRSAKVETPFHDTPAAAAVLQKPTAAESVPPPVLPTDIRR